jgi:anti-sigma regulatory factor (Ser/Thr protein kinase)
MTTCKTSFPCRPESARQARRWVAQCLPGDCPAAEDLVLIVSELVTNSACHAARGTPVTVRLVIAAGAWVRIEVRDGGPARPAVHRARDPLEEGGRGLLIVGRLASLYRDGRGLACARLPWSGTAPGDGARDGGAGPGTSWEQRWLEVMTRAGWQCQCAGQCGRPHRCPAEDLPGRPLHVVPAVPAGDAVAATLPAESLAALCAVCRAGAGRAASRAATAAVPQPDALFAPGGGA